MAYVSAVRAGPDCSKLAQTFRLQAARPARRARGCSSNSSSRPRRTSCIAEREAQESAADAAYAKELRYKCASSLRLGPAVRSA